MTAPLLGFQIADSQGNNIQGDEGDPSGFPSFHILSAEEATKVVAANPDHLLLLMPIFEGTIEEPTFTDGPQGA